MIRPARSPLTILVLSAVVTGCASRTEPAVPPPAPSPVVAPAGVETPAVPALVVVRPDALDEMLAMRRRSLASAGRRVVPAEVGYYMDVQQARLQQVGGSWLGVVRRGQSVRLSLPGRWSFTVGSANLSSSAEAALASVAAVLIDYRLSLITVHGHTDDSGDASFNRTLSERRALAVARHLVSEGVAADRIVIVGHGSAIPLASNDSADGREENRRVELQVDPLL